VDEQKREKEMKERRTSPRVTEEQYPEDPSFAG